MPNPSDCILGFREMGKKVVALVESSADKQELPRFRPPEGKTLRHACLVLISRFKRDYNGDVARCDLARVFGDQGVRNLGRRPSQPLYRRLGPENPLPSRFYKLGNIEPP